MHLENKQQDFFKNMLINYRIMLFFNIGGALNERTTARIKK